MYCKHCGNKVDDEAVICTKCGCLVNESDFYKNNKSYNQKNMILAIKIFALIGCVVSSIFIIPACWQIPMVVILLNKLNKKEPISITFKICYLLFCNLIAGILLLNMED